MQIRQRVIKWPFKSKVFSKSVPTITTVRTFQGLLRGSAILVQTTVIELKNGIKLLHIRGPYIV